MATQTLTTAQLAKRWNVTPHYLRRLRQHGRGPAYFRPSDAVRGHVRYRLADIIEWEKAQTEGGSKAPSPA